MATWNEFAEAAPEMAERGGKMLAIPLAYLATVRMSGAPRLHPLSPILAGGRLFVAIQSTSPRRFDLARDGRYSLHTLPPELGPDYDEFEFNVTGTASRVTDAATLDLIDEAEAARDRPSIPRHDWVFELDIESALTSVWNHRMIEVDGRWLPSLAGEQPQATRTVWSGQGRT